MTENVHSFVLHTQGAVEHIGGAFISMDHLEEFACKISAQVDSIQFQWVTSTYSKFRYKNYFSTDSLIELPSAACWYGVAWMVPHNYICI